MYETTPCTGMMHHARTECFIKSKSISAFVRESGQEYRSEYNRGSPVYMIKKKAKAPGIPDDTDITLRDVIVHSQHNFQLLQKQISNLDKRLTKAVDSLREELHADRKGTDDLDFRVQELEEEKLPMRVERIEKHLQLAF